MAAHAADLEASLVKSEPVLAGSAALWICSQVGELLYGHTDLISRAQWTPLQSTLIPLVTTVLLALFGWLVRAVVTPVAKLVDADPALAAELGVVAPMVEDLAAAVQLRMEATYRMSAEAP